MPNWYIYDPKDRLTLGPFAPEVVLERFFDEKITEHTLVRGDHFLEWRPLAEYRGQLEQETRAGPPPQLPSLPAEVETLDLAGEVLSYGVHVFLVLRGLAVGGLVSCVAYLTIAWMSGGLSTGASAPALGGPFLFLEFGMAAFIGIVVGAVFYFWGLRDGFHGVLSLFTALASVIIGKFAVFVVSVARDESVAVSKLLFSGDFSWLPEDTLSLLVYLGAAPGIIAGSAAWRFATWSSTK